MPIVQKGNNRILPPNSRAVDVATRAIEDLTAVQQQKTMNAFRVQGFSCILYNRHKSGIRCTCQSGAKALNTVLDKEGKASVGTLNELLTGSSFGISAYGSETARKPLVDPTDPNVMNITSPHDGNKFRGTFNVVGRPGDYNNVNQVEDGFGDNGPVQALDLDDIVGDFDSLSMGFSDAHCTICFGTGFVGGYSPFYSNRQVLTPNQVDLPVDAELLADTKPWSCTSSGFSARIVVPKGARSIESFRLWNGSQLLPFTFTLDGLAGTVQQVMRMANGLPHDLVVQFEFQQWTHFELQFNINANSAWFEFPRLTKGNDLSLLDQLEPFQILISPNVPQLSPEDVIVEQTTGKTLMVQSVPMWNTRNRRILGWDCQVRVCQPQEIYTLLPQRGRVPGKSRTTNMVRDNGRGTFRT